jgi:Ca2+-binding EF-hand superfamily protein
MKTFIAEPENSIYDLKYENVFKLLSEIGKTIEKIDEIEDDLSESGIEITPEEYLQITDKVLYKISHNLGYKPDTHFRDLVNKDNGVELIDLKSFLYVCTEALNMDLDDIEIYCLFNRFKFDEENIDDENMDYKKLKKEILAKKSTGEMINKLKSHFDENKTDVDKLLSSLSPAEDGSVDIEAFKSFLSKNNINVAVPDKTASELDPLIFEKKINIIYLKALISDEKKPIGENAQYSERIEYKE